MLTGFNINPLCSLIHCFGLIVIMLLVDILCLVLLTMEIIVLISLLLLLVFIHYLNKIYPTSIHRKKKNLNLN
jgi:hypothetical protein